MFLIHADWHTVIGAHHAPMCVLQLLNNVTSKDKNRAYISAAFRRRVAADYYRDRSASMVAMVVLSGEWGRWQYLTLNCGCNVPMCLSSSVQPEAAQCVCVCVCVWVLHRVYSCVGKFSLDILFGGLNMFFDKINSIASTRWYISRDMADRTTSLVFIFTNVTLSCFHLPKDVFISAMQNKSWIQQLR